MKKCIICNIATALAAVGAINWGLVALLDVNVVTRLAGEGTMVTKVVYILVGVSGILMLLSLVKQCPCNKK